MKNFLRMNSPGFGVLEMLVGVSLLAMTFYLTSVASGSVRKRTDDLRRETLALSYATELAEFFRSLSGAELNAYLSKNPVTNLPSGLYPLCSHVNILDRVHSSPSHALILNEDPLASLEPSVLDLGPKNREANRFYQVQVVNMKTQEVLTAKCGTLPPYDFDRVNFPDERFQVTVGVTWVKPGTNEVFRNVVTTLLPD